MYNVGTQLIEKMDDVHNELMKRCIKKWFKLLTNDDISVEKTICIDRPNKNGIQTLKLKVSSSGGTTGN